MNPAEDFDPRQIDRAKLFEHLAKAKEGTPEHDAYDYLRCLLYAIDERIVEVTDDGRLYMTPRCPDHP